MLKGNWAATSVNLFRRHLTPHDISSPLIK